MVASSGNKKKPFGLAILFQALQSELASQFSVLLGGRIVAAVIQAISIYLLARWSDVADFGMFAAALGIAITFQSVADAGATTFAVREAAAHGVNRKISEADLLSRVVMAFMAGIGAVITLGLCYAYGSDYLALLPFSCWIVVDRSSDMRSAIARGLGDVRIGTANIISRRLFQLLLFVLAYYAGVSVPWAYSLSLLGGSLLVLVAMSQLLPRPPQVSFRRHSLLHAFIRCRPYWVHSATTQLRNLDVVIVAGLSGATEAAYYGVAARLMTPLRMLPASLATALMPYLVRRGGVDRKDVRMGGGLAILLSIPYVFLVVLSPFIIKHLGEDYAGAVLPVQIMCFGLCGASAISIFTAILQANQKAELVSRVSIIAAIAFLVMGSIGAMIFGAVGASIGFVAAIFAQAAMLLYKVR